MENGQKVLVNEFGMAIIKDTKNIGKLIDDIPNDLIYGIIVDVDALFIDVKLPIRHLCFGEETDIWPLTESEFDVVEEENE